MERSKFFSLNLWDFAKSLFLAVLAAVITYLYQAISAGDWWSITTLKQMGIVALTTALAYLLKNLFTNVKGELAPDK